MIDNAVVQMPANPPGPAIGHVLFLDIVEYSRAPSDVQLQFIDRLSEAVRRTRAYQNAHAANAVVPLPTGDGMALSFKENLLAPAECAYELAQHLSELPFKLRMGIHGGVVQWMVDISGRPNVAGEGINMAQRVMDAAKPGEILMTEQYASWLTHFEDWRDRLGPFGEFIAKHGVRIRAFRLLTGPNDTLTPEPTEGLPAELPARRRLDRPHQIDPQTLLPRVSMIPPFRQVPERTLRQVLEHGRVRQVAKNQHIFWEGDPGSMIFLVLSGQVAIERLNEQGEPIMIAIRAEGEIFGELALFEIHERSADARTLVDSSLLILDGETIIKEAGNCSALALGLVDVVSAKLRESIDNRTIMRRDVPQRLAVAIMHELDDNGVALSTGGWALGYELSEIEWGLRIGSDAAPVQKALNHLQESGVLTFQGNKLGVTDLGALRRFAGFADR